MRAPQPLPGTEGEANFVAWEWSPDGERLAGTFGGAASGVGYYSFAARRDGKPANVEAYPMSPSDGRRFVYFAEGKVYVADT